MRTEAWIGLLVAAALAAGCGQTPSSARDFEGEQRSVAEAVEELQSAGERGEASRICRDLVTDSLREALAAGGRSCDVEVDKALDDADVLDLEVTKVTVTGTRATAVVEAADDPRDVVRTFELVKESGVWRIASLGSAPARS